MDRTSEFESRWFQAGPWRMHTRLAEAAGRAAPPVVLVHGLGVSGSYLLPVGRCLAREFRVYVPDLPGFGRSQKPRRSLTLPQLSDALAAWFESVGLSSAMLLGNSMGCQTIVDLAWRHATLVERAVLQAPTVDGQARTAWRQILRLLQDAPREKPSLALIVLRDYLRCGIPRLLATFREALRDPIETKLPDVHQPMLVVCGARDPIVPQNWAAELAKRLQHGRLVVLPDAPHAANYTTPLELYRVVRPFFEANTIHRASSG